MWKRRACIVLGGFLLVGCVRRVPLGELPDPGPGARELVLEPAEISFRLDEGAFSAPPVSYPVPFDVIAADMELDGDSDLLVNWHNLARLELFENVGGHFVLRNPEDDDRSGLFENPGIASVYAEAEPMVQSARASAKAGVFVWHDPNPRDDWNFLVRPEGEPVTLWVRGNRPLTPKLQKRFIVQSGDFDATFEIDVETRFRVDVAFVATQIQIRASIPIYVGHAQKRVEPHETIALWKDDPHGMAWVNVRGTAEPDIFVTRGGLMGTLRPPHDPKIDRLFEYVADQLLYADERGHIPASYGRGRKVAWVDVDGDMVSELYIGNTDSPNSLLVADVEGRYVDVGRETGLDFMDGDTFAWLDVDANGLDDLVFVASGGFQIAYNRGERVFDMQPGDRIGLSFPIGSLSDPEDLFATLSLHVLDYDNDGRLDLWLVGHGPDLRHTLYRATESGFVDVTVPMGLDDVAPTLNQVVLDVDNDGYLDAITIGRERVLLQNNGGRGFTPRSFGADWDLPAFARAVAIDADGDGRLDIALMGERRLLARNTTLGGGHALRVKIGAGSGDPVGTLVTAVFADGTAQVKRYGSANTTQYSQGLAPLRFGNVPERPIERLLVQWPDGYEETRVVSPGQAVVELWR